ncbi:MAG TPA: hypothetical protein VJJ73_01125 [Candidatus Paceibacterota bacterium]
MIKRILADSAIIAGVAVFPWYVIFPIAVIFVFLFHNFFEIIALGFLIDGLYSVPSGNIFYGHFGVFTVLGLVGVVASEYVKTKLFFLS